MRRLPFLFRPSVLCALTLQLALGACADDPATDLALSSLRSFEAALENADHDALRRSVTTRSREYVTQLPARPKAQPLTIRSARREHSRIYFEVEDLSADAPVREGCFVVAKEDGRWLVDLIDTAAQSARDVVSEGPSTKQFVPAELPRAEVEAAIRRHESEAREASAQRSR